MAKKKKKVSKKNLAKANQVKAQKKAKELSIPIELQVTDTAHAKSEAVVRYAIAELEKGSTWNELRCKLGLKHAGVDKRWRALKDILCSAVMPANEQEALKSSLAMSSLMMEKMQRFLEKVEKRAEALEGDDNETDMLKIQLEAIKVQSAQFSKQFEHYAKFRDMIEKDKKSQGPSIIFQNNYYVPRPGDNVKFVDGRPVIDVPPPEPDMKEVGKFKEGANVPDN